MSKKTTKNKRMKKMIAMLMTLVLVFGVLPMGVMATNALVEAAEYAVGLVAPAPATGRQTLVNEAVAAINIAVAELGDVEALVNAANAAIEDAEDALEIVNDAYAEASLALNAAAAANTAFNTAYQNFINAQTRAAAIVLRDAEALVSVAWNAFVTAQNAANVAANAAVQEIRNGDAPDMTAVTALQDTADDLFQAWYDAEESFVGGIDTSLETVALDRQETRYDVAQAHMAAVAAMIAQVDYITAVNYAVAEAEEAIELAGRLYDLRTYLMGWNGHNTPAETIPGGTVPCIRYRFAPYYSSTNLPRCCAMLTSAPRRIIAVPANTPDSLGSMIAIRFNPQFNYAGSAAGNTTHAVNAFSNVVFATFGTHIRLICGITDEIIVNRQTNANPVGTGGVNDVVFPSNPGYAWMVVDADGNHINYDLHNLQHGVSNVRLMIEIENEGGSRDRLWVNGTLTNSRFYAWPCIPGTTPPVDVPPINITVAIINYVDVEAPEEFTLVDLALGNLLAGHTFSIPAQPGQPIPTPPPTQPTPPPTEPTPTPPPTGGDGRGNWVGAGPVQRPPTQPSQPITEVVPPVTAAVTPPPATYVPLQATPVQPVVPAYVPAITTAVTAVTPPAADTPAPRVNPPTGVEAVNNEVFLSLAGIAVFAGVLILVVKSKESAA